MKISFMENGVAFIDEIDGEYEVSDDLLLIHRYELVDGAVVDKYDGISDYELRLVEYQAVVDAYAANVDEDGNPAPLDPPPPPYPTEGSV